MQYDHNKSIYEKQHMTSKYNKRHKYVKIMSATPGDMTLKLGVVPSYFNFNQDIKLM